MWEAFRQTFQPSHIRRECLAHIDSEKVTFPGKGFLQLSSQPIALLQTLKSMLLCYLVELDTLLHLGLLPKCPFIGASLDSEVRGLGSQSHMLRSFTEA